MNTNKSPNSNADFDRYTSGRWLYGEQIQLRRRYLEFNIPALKECASQELGTRCVRTTKLPEGLYNKVFSLEMEDGREILARIPNPNAGYPDDIVASEVATLDFVRGFMYVFNDTLDYCSSAPGAMIYFSTESVLRIYP